MTPDPDTLRRKINATSSALARAKVERDEAIRAAIRAGLSLRDVALHSGLSHQRIAAIRDNY